MTTSYRRTVTDLARQLKQFFAGRVPNQEDAEELAQESITRALESELRFRGDATVRTWVFAIARNVLREYRGRHAFVTAFPEEPVASDGVWPVRRHTPYDATDRLALAQAVAGLPVYLRELFELRYTHGLPLAECAARLGRPLGTVKYQLHIAREHLRFRLNAEADPTSTRLG